MIAALRARLAGLAPETPLRIPWLTAASSRWLARPGVGSRVVFGALTGLIPCGLVYAALSFQVALGDPLQGALAMVVFGTGTVVVLSVAAVGLRCLASTTPWVRRGVAAAVMAAGPWSLGLREMALLQPTPDPAPPYHNPGPEGVPP